MKTIIKFLIVFFIVGCKAQVITPIYGPDPNDGVHPNRYYKDIANDFAPYVGTWAGNSGNETLTITFNTTTNVPGELGDYFDMLVGEYSYQVSSNVLVDTHPELFTTDSNGVPIIIQPNPWDNSITVIGITDMDEWFPPCPECSPNSRVIVLDIIESSNPPLWGKIRMTRFVESGVEKIRMQINNTFAESHQPLSIPEDSIWTLIKQN
ncbi:MAG TPA: DUF6705 family protein [Xanthomarina sp.]|nr:DUF6705 family protein [Xanthomarina sp.]